MKVLRYQIIVSGKPADQNEHSSDPVISEKTIPHSIENEEIAKAEAYNGEYTIEDDGKPEPAPTQLDRIEAQATYTAMMTDTLMEG
mgnify:CR=1 FL=1